MDEGEISCVEPAVLGERATVCLGVLVVAGHPGHAAYLKPADVVLGQQLAVGTDDPYRRAPDRCAYLGERGMAGGGRRKDLERLVHAQVPDRDDARRFVVAA